VLGIGAGAAVVDCVDVVLVVDVCAAATPVIIERPIAVISQVLIMPCSRSLFCQVIWVV
jgi:hypothetical protein